MMHEIWEEESHQKMNKQIQRMLPQIQMTVEARVAHKLTEVVHKTHTRKYGTCIENEQKLM
ncbi:hypothetical protein YC2023_022067 [Brassica napus]